MADYANLLKLALGGDNDSKSYNLSGLSSLGSPGSKAVEIAQLPTLQDVQAKQYRNISDSIKEGQLTPLSAILKGVTGAVADNKESASQAARDAKLKEWADYYQSRQKQVDEMQDMALARQNAMGRQQEYGDALSMAANGNGAPLVGLIKSDEPTTRYISRQLELPEGAQLNEVHVVTGSDGQPQLIGSALLPDGTVVNGTGRIPYLTLQGAIAPQAQRAQMQAQAAETELAARQAREQAEAEQQARLTEAQIGNLQSQTRERDNPTANVKPLSPTIAKLQDENLNAIGTVGQVNESLGKVLAQIRDNKLDTGIVSRGYAAIRNGLNASTDETRALADYESSLKKIVNDSLLLNKGVQTEGDAQRAAQAILSAPNDTAAVAQRLTELQSINERAADLRKLQNDQLRAEYGQQPLDYSAYGPRQAATQAQPSQFNEGQTATNPQTGEKIVFRGGQWQRQ